MLEKRPALGHFACNCSAALEENKFKLLEHWQEGGLMCMTLSKDSESSGDNKLAATAISQLFAGAKRKGIEI